MARVTVAINVGLRLVLGLGLGVIYSVRFRGEMGKKNIDHGALVARASVTYSHSLHCILKPAHRLHVCFILLVVCFYDTVYAIRTCMQGI